MAKMTVLENVMAEHMSMENKTFSAMLRIGLAKEELKHDKTLTILDSLIYRNMPTKPVAVFLSAP